MTDMSTSPVARRDVETCAGGGHAASGAAGWLNLAAAPAFAIMALWTGLFSGQLDMHCMGMQDASPLNGMALMYGLMSAFGAAPWLKLISRRRSRPRVVIAHAAIPMALTAFVSARTGDRCGGCRKSAD